MTFKCPCQLRRHGSSSSLPSCLALSVGVWCLHCSHHGSSSSLPSCLALSVGVWCLHCSHRGSSSVASRKFLSEKAFGRQCFLRGSRHHRPSCDGSGSGDEQC